MSRLVSPLKAITRMLAKIASITIPFEKTTPVDSGPLSFLESYREFINLGIKYGALIFAALLLLIFVIRPAKRALKAAAAAPRLTAGATPLLAAGSSQQRLGEAVSTTSPDRAIPGQNADAAQSVGSGSARTVAELQAEMDAEATLDESRFAEAQRSNAIRKRLMERTEREPEMVAMTIRSWLQEQ